MAAHVPSYKIGAVLLREVGGISITGRGLNTMAVRIGTEMIEERDARTEAYFNAPLPRQYTQPEMPIALACVSIDGGRMQTRTEGCGKGVHHAHWRENKNALFMRMKSDSFTCDPHPELPACFADPEKLKSLLPGVIGDGTSTLGIKTPPVAEKSKTDSGWRPEPLFRTCISSLECSDRFGRMMQVEADSRGFYHAAKKACVCDGLPYNWTIQERHFRDFTPILDFTHLVEKLYTAARSLHSDPKRRWEDYLRWAHACWSGEGGAVLAELRQQQPHVGFPPADCEKTDPRKLLAEAISYLANNIPRMDYPRYRQEGLPTTSAHMESLVKEINHRVKGTEKFWNDGASGEAILQIRAAALCDDDRLQAFLRRRPGHPFHRNVPRSIAPAMAS